jgi:hypothetical protein
LRGIIGMALVVGLLASITLPVNADTTTGNIQGQITSPNGQPAANVGVIAAAPSGRFTARSDAKGFFSLVGLTPDTYTVTFSLPGYQDAVINGVTVNATQTTTVNQALVQRLKSIGTTTSRASGVSAFQPQQPVDTYSVTGTQIQTALGKPHGTSESALLTTLPGATTDSSGYPVIRGGRENDEGFQFEGIDYTDAITSQFVNGLNLNGVQSFQLSPGAGDASVGNAGTGQINITVKRGSRPAFGSVEQDIGAPSFNRQFAAEYGFATPNGRLSNYLSFTGQGNGYTYGNHANDLEYIGRPSSNYYRSVRDFVNNAVYRFGRDNSQSLQLLYQNQSNTFFSTENFPNPYFRSNDPVFLYYANLYTGLSKAEIQQVMPLSYGQVDPIQRVNRPYAQNQPNDTVKLQYTNSLNASTYFTAKFYKVNATAIFDNPYNDAASYGPGAVGDEYSLQGGQRTGFAADITKQLGSKHLLALGGKYEFVHPINTYNSATYGLFNDIFDPVGGQELFDALPANSPSCDPTGAAGPVCGYLQQYFPNGVPRLPAYDQSPQTNRHDLSYYISDQFQATDKLKINAGLRVDGTHFELPGLTDGAYLPASGNGYTSAYYYPTATTVDAAGNPIAAKDVLADPGNERRQPSVLEPRFGFAYQFNPRNSVTFSYGRSVQLPAISYVDARAASNNTLAFAGIPADLTVCGPTGDRACRDYADQLYWLQQNNGAGIPIEAAKPATFTNYDASLQHDFGNGLAVKLTPFYRRGYDVFALVASQRIVNGVPLVDANGNPQLNPSVTTNAGINRTTGLEFYLTKTATYGFSGSLAMTYINEFSNVIPTSANEDFFPSIPPPSLALGNQYRVGFISPFNVVAALQYRTHSGFRINPIVSYDRGYPYGSGNLTAIAYNGTNYNVPQTNVTNQSATGGTTGATNYVDPANPGSIFNPNIAASRGTPETSSAGGNLTKARLNTTVSFEFNRPNTRNTVGVLVGNLFNQLYGEPALNARYQPVATGISGPLSGSSSNTARFGPGLGYVNYGSVRGYNQPYLLTPNGSPRTFRLYYQYAL